MLDRLELTLRAGEYVAIMGESGVGKSTLLNLIAGLDRADAGRVLLQGQDLSRLDDDALTLLRRRSIGFVFQAFHVLAFLTVEQNVALPLELLGVPQRERNDRARQMLVDVGLGSQGGRFPRELSGGELQRVAIARALIHRPALVLADEPTGNLDPRTARQILDLLQEQLHCNRSAAILITHSRAAARSADRALLLDTHGLHPLDTAAADRE